MMIKVEIKQVGLCIEKTIKVLGLTVYKKVISPFIKEDDRDLRYFFSA
jgi:hypothetical protein